MWPSDSVRQLSPLKSAPKDSNSYLNGQILSSFNIMQILRLNKKHLLGEKKKIKQLVNSSKLCVQIWPVATSNCNHIHAAFYPHPQNFNSISNFAWLLLMIWSVHSHFCRFFMPGVTMQVWLTRYTYSLTNFRVIKWLDNQNLCQRKLHKASLLFPHRTPKSGQYNV
jgi:hypothetical protein